MDRAESTGERFQFHPIEHKAYRFTVPMETRANDFDRCALRKISLGDAVFIADVVEYYQAR